MLTKLTSYDDKGSAKIVLKEDDPSATLKIVPIRGLVYTNTVAFKLDVGKRISYYLNPSAPKINKACNGIIFTELNNKYYVFICELKSSKPNIQDCIIKSENYAEK